MEHGNARQVQISSLDATLNPNAFTAALDDLAGTVQLTDGQMGGATAAAAWGVMRDLTGLRRDSKAASHPVLAPLQL